MEVRTLPLESDSPYQEFLRSPDLSVGYRLRPAATGSQRPHKEDEVYYVLADRAKFTANGKSVEIEGGYMSLCPCARTAQVSRHH